MKTIEDTTFDPHCAAQHFGMWAIEPHWFCTAVESVRAGTYAAETVTQRGRILYVVDDVGVARVPISGQIMKGDSKFGGTSSLRVRQAVRKAIGDGDVKSIVLHIDSPGGTVAGTANLANDVKMANQVKPVVAHIDDLGASAAYWVASQARWITATATSEIGSIGTVAVVEDSSEKAELEGIKVHVISTGEFKGIGVDGAPVLPSHLEYLQSRVEDLNGHFLHAVKKGRNMSIEAVRKLADGKVHIAGGALSLGLIDGLGSLEDAMKMAGRLADSEIKTRREAGSLRSRRAGLT